MFDFVKAWEGWCARWIWFDSDCYVHWKRKASHFAHWWFICGIYSILMLLLFDNINGKTENMLGDYEQFLHNVSLLIQVLSRSGKMEVLTDAHRPYGSNKISLQEIKRIREAGGWVCFLAISVESSCSLLLTALTFFLAILMIEIVLNLVSLVAISLFSCRSILLILESKVFLEIC